MLSGGQGDLLNETRLTLDETKGYLAQGLEGYLSQGEQIEPDDSVSGVSAATKDFMEFEGSTIEGTCEVRQMGLNLMARRREIDSIETVKRDPHAIGVQGYRIP